MKDAQRVRVVDPDVDESRAAAMCLSQGLKSSRLAIALVGLMLLGWNPPLSSKEPVPTLNSKLPAVSQLEQLEGQRAVLPQGMQLREVSKRGLALLETSEGFVPHLYNDSAHYCTIGYGRLIKKSPCDGTEDRKYQGNISRQASEQWLKEDLAQAEIIVMTAVRDQDQLNDDQYSALVDIVYNIGGSNFRNSSLLQAVNANPRQLDRIPAQFRRWVRAGGKTFPGLVKRRNQEVALFFYGSAIPRGVPIPGEDLSPLDILASIER